VTDPDQDADLEEIRRDRLARLGLDPARQAAYSAWKHKTLLWNLARLGLTEDDLEHSK